MARTISEADIRAGLSALSADQILAELANHSATKENVSFFLDLLQRSNHVFFKYPNPKREILRDELFSRIETHVRENFTSETQERFHEVVKIIRRVELGYRNLLAILSKTPIRQRPPVVQSSAALELIAQRLDFIQQRARDSLRQAKTLVYSDEVMATLDDGSKFNVDAATTGFIENLGTTIGMLAHENNWIKGDETVVLPPFGESGDDHIKESETTEILATSWRRWERAEQRRRYWGGEFIDIEGGKPVSGMPPDVRAYFEYRRPEDDLYDWVANERVKEYIMQNFAELRFETFAKRKAAGISGPIKLFPDQFVNLQEVNSAGFLSMLLGVDVRSDATSYSGLRMVEWLRGYCALSEMAGESIEKGKSPRDRNLIRFDPGQLEDKLVTLGLSAKSSEQFVLNTVFADRSDDLFDCPLLKCTDGSILLFAPASVHVDPGVVTYSNLVSLQDRLEGKGKRFEESVVRFFQEKNFKPYSVRASRNGELFEIDVLLPWNEYLFVFECKNRGLSEHHPIQSYYFREERSGFIQQVQRQVKGLLDYPDMSIEASGINPREKKIVPCVLYALPYAEPGPIEGVFIADWSSLSRFFKNRYLKSKQPHELFGRHRLLHRSALYSFWNGKEPTPEDLLRQLSNPVQVQIVRSRMERIESVFIVDENGVGVTTEYQRGSMRMKDLGDLLGFDFRAVSHEERRVKKMVAALNKKLEKKQVISQTRAFRESDKRRK
jgi:nuclease-like protein